MRIKPLEPHVPGAPGQTLTQMKVLYVFCTVVAIYFVFQLFGLFYLWLAPWTSPRALRAETKATMKPSPRAFTSRPSCSATQLRTISSCARRIWWAAVSPRWVRRSVEPSTSLNRMVSGPVRERLAH
jgi:hypothetical protein